MSLIQELDYKEYKDLCCLNIEQCQIIATLANLNITFNNTTNPGQLLAKYLDRKGCSVSQYKNYLNKALNTKTVITYYKPQSKVAILIANNKYDYLSKLVTPSIDCDSLASNLKMLGFISIVVKDTKNKDLKVILVETFKHIPEDSYCFIFYAGHGCELCNTKCILSIDCPTENIDYNHCITENWLLREVAICKPELCVMIMDMCRKKLDSEENPKIFSDISNIEEYTIHSNLIISYSTQASESAYEVLQIEHSETIDNEVTYELKTGDTDKIVPCASQYVNVLCTRLFDNYDINTLLDKVHGGDHKDLLEKLKDGLQEYQKNNILYFVI